MDQNVECTVSSHTSHRTHRTPPRNAAKNFLSTLKRLMKQDDLEEDSTPENKQDDLSKKFRSTKKKISPKKSSKRNSGPRRKPLSNTHDEQGGSKTTGPGDSCIQSTQKQHSGSKLCVLSCGQCGATFSGPRRRSQLTSHVLKEHGSQCKELVLPPTDSEMANEQSGLGGKSEDVVAPVSGLIKGEDGDWKVVCDSGETEIGHLLWPSVVSLDTDSQLLDDHKQYFCPTCKTQFKTLDNLNKHKPCKHSIVCTICDKRFKCAYQLKRHQTNTKDCGKRKVYKAKQPHKCSECGKTFSSSGALNVHRLIHKDFKPYKCNQCEKSFSQLGNMKTHIRVVHEKFKSFKCTQCDKAYAQRSGLNYHLRTHLEDKLQAEYKELIMSNKDHTMEAANTTEAEQKVFYCMLCRQPYRKVFLLLRHLKEHLDTDNSLSDAHRDNIQTFVRKHYEVFTMKTFPCTKCPKFFFLKQDLTDHLAKHCGKVHKCEYCNREFKVKRTLRVHLQHHTKKYTHRCDKCGEGFALKSSLNYHMFKVHDMTLKGQYHCSLCAEVFRSRTMLETHKRSAHKKEKKFTCNNCGKNFATKYAMQVHARTHTNEKPYKCTLCPRSFADQSNLIHHGTKVHPAAPKAIFYRRKGWTTEKMDQVAAGTVLSIDSSQLQTMHELSTLGEEDLPSSSPSCRDKTDSIKDIDLAEDIPLSYPQSYNKVAPDTSIPSEQSPDQPVSSTGDMVTLAKFQANKNTSDSSILPSGNVCFEFDQEDHSQSETIQIIEGSEVLGAVDAPLATPPLPSKPEEVSNTLGVLEVEDSPAGSDLLINTKEIFIEVCKHTHGNQKLSNVQPVTEETKHANEMSVPQVAHPPMKTMSDPERACPQAASLQSTRDLSDVTLVADQSLHCQVLPSVGASLVTSCEEAEDPSQGRVIVSSLEIPSSEIGHWQSVLQTVQHMIQPGAPGEHKAIQLVMKDSDNENSTFIVHI